MSGVEGVGGEDEVWGVPVEGAEEPGWLKRVRRGWEAEKARVAVEGPSWASELLVWREIADPDGGPGVREVDVSRCVAEMVRHDGTAAREIARRYGGEFLSVVGEGARRRFRRWNGRIWDLDRGEVSVHARVDEFWSAYGRALEQLGRAIDLEGESAADRARMSGGNDEQAEKAAAAVVKARRGAIKKHGEFWERLGNHSGRQAAMGQLALVPGRCRTESDFDDAPGLLVMRNGVLDLSALNAMRVGEGGVGAAARLPVVDLLDHSSARPVTLCAPEVDYAPGVGIGPEWTRYIEGVLPDPELRWYLQKALGSTLLGDPREKIVLELVGRKDAGKTLLLNVLLKVMGDYATSVAPKIFLEKKQEKSGEEGEPVLHSLRRRKLVVTSEPPSNKRFDPELIKRITGRENMSTRTLHEGEMSSWKPGFLLVVTCNEPVKFDVADKAGTDRIAPVVFPVQFRQPNARLGETWESIPVGERMDSGLEARILESEAELSGVLNWLLAGLEGYVREGLAEPEQVRQTREDLVEAQSGSIAWLEAQIASGRILQDAGASAAVSGNPWSACIGETELYNAYVEDMGRPGVMAEGETVIGNRTFKAQIKPMGTSEPHRRVTRGKASGGQPDNLIWNRLRWWDWRTRHGVPEESDGS